MRKIGASLVSCGSNRSCCCCCYCVHS